MLTLLGFTCLFCANVIAQKTDDATKWLKENQGRAIEKNKSTGGYLRASPGFAQYISVSGEVRQPYLVYVPKSYDPARAMPVFVFLHGAILALDSFQNRSPEVSTEPIFKAAEDLQFIAIFPFARHDFKWTNDERVFLNILKMVEDTRKRYNIASDKIFVGGQSMGGNATFWFIKNKPELFAGFYTFSAALSGEGNTVKGRISVRKPLVSMNAMDDGVFSFEQAKKAHDDTSLPSGAWTFETAPTGGHRFIYGSGGAKYVTQSLQRLLTAGGK